MIPLTLLFYFWASILLAWGGLCMYRMYSIRKLLKANGQKGRKQDIQVCAVVCGFEVTFGSIVLFFPSLPVLMIEVLLCIAFWYTAVLTYAYFSTSNIARNLS